MMYQKANISKAVKLLLSESAAVSFPVPCIENGIQTERHFVYSMIANKKQFRPFAVLTTAMEDGTILSYCNCHLKDYLDTEKHPFFTQVNFIHETISVAALKKNIVDLYDCYQSVRDIVWKSTLSENEASTVRKYRDIFDEIVSDELKPFYLALNPEFFDWLYDC